VAFGALALLASRAVLNNRQHSFAGEAGPPKGDYHHEDAKTRRVWCQAAESTYLGCVRYVLASNYDSTGWSGPRTPWRVEHADLPNPQ
jgi:hypothetical protein